MTDNGAKVAVIRNRLPRASRQDSGCLTTYQDYTQGRVAGWCMAGQGSTPWTWVHHPLGTPPGYTTCTVPCCTVSCCTMLYVQEGDEGGSQPR